MSQNSSVTLCHNTVTRITHNSGMCWLSCCGKDFFLLKSMVGIIFWWQICPLCHFVTQSTLIQLWFQKNRLLLPTASWPSSSSLLLKYIKAVEFFITAVDALVVSRTTESLCPLSHSSLSHLSLEQGVGRCTYFPSDSYPIMCQGPPPLFITLYICANSLLFLCGRENCQVSFDSTLHTVSYDKQLQIWQE